MLNSTTKFTRTASLPSSCTRSTAMALLQNYEFMINCDSNLSSYKPVTNPANPPTIPSHLKSKTTSSTKTYAIYDKVENIPGGIWKSDVECIVEYTDLETGLFMKGKSPLSIVIETEWNVKENAGGNGGLELVYESLVSCSKLIIGIIKGTLEKNLVEMMEKVVAELEKRSKE
ncbi:hypothetical protein BKA65DRAFT_466228 [Rhexocercosporidium sp. MPI-PUGE-AT-0058]|nr:hypothetical protein BKA65DRAFT_466228 [Rhexocercosporidium sp. MPI-PUGE-AT-0058]